MTKTDAYIEVVLWNQSMDRLIRVLGQLELHLIRSRENSERTPPAWKKSGPD